MQYDIVDKNNVINFINSIQYGYYIWDYFLGKDYIQKCKRDIFISSMNYIYNRDNNKNKWFTIHGKRREGVTYMLSNIAKTCSENFDVFILNPFSKDRQITYGERLYKISDIRGRIDKSKSIVIIDNAMYFNENLKELQIYLDKIPVIIGQTY